MRLRMVLSAGLMLALLLPASSGAKGFPPGEVGLCDSQTCVVIGEPKVSNALARFFYGRPSPAEAAAPRLGAPYLQLRLSNGNVTGIAATARLDRFRSSGGTNQFGPDTWYRVPQRLATALRKLAAPLQPLHVTSTTLAWKLYH